MSTIPPQLPPVAMPEGLEIEPVPEEKPDRELLRAKLRERTSQMASKRSKKGPKASAQIHEAAQQVGATSEAAQAHAMLNTMRAEDIANLVHSTVRSGAVPSQVMGLIPPEARNLSKKELVKLISQLQKK